MDLLKLISSLEELIVEIALWIILLPRTLWSAIVTPVKLARYFDQTQEIPEKERDEKYLSPVLFWLLIAPTSLIIWLMRQDQEALKFYGAQPKEQFGTAAFMLLGFPLSFAAVTTWFRGESLSKRTLGREFALQCYFNAPMSALFMLSLALEPQLGHNVSTMLFGISLAWFCITEVRIAKRDGAVRHPIVLVALGYGFAGFLMFAITLAIECALVLSGRLPGFR